MSEVGHSELVALFGRRVVDMATVLDVAHLDITAKRMAAVQKATEALMELNGQPDGQRAVVKGLETYTALLLCMWLMDTGMFERLLEQAA